MCLGSRLMGGAVHIVSIRQGFGAWLAAAVLLLCAAAAPTAQAATTQIVNLDGANEGLNDPAPVEPIGGNDGTTLGEQRRIALQYAADIIGSRVASAVPIRITARFDRFACSRNSAALGQASPAQFSLGFRNAPNARTFYPLALANALAGRRIASNTDDINAVFTSSLDDGDPDCLLGSRWYYGLDGRRPEGMVSFLSTAVHELMHGFGFVSLVALDNDSGRSLGQFPRTTGGDRRPDIFSRFIQDLSLPGQPLWTDLSDAQRADSISNGPDVVWRDATTADGAARILDDGLNQGFVPLYAPAMVNPGSSISHWDPALDPDQIMEPFATGSDNVANGIGLSACVLENIGWQLINGTRCPDQNSEAIAGDIGIAPVPQSSVDSGDDGGGDSGGGCTLDPDARFDPLWLLLLALAAGTLYCRRQGRA